MNEKTTTKEDFNAISELAKDAQSIEDLATLREMAAQDYGNGSTTVYERLPSGEVKEVPVTTLGAEEYARATKDLAAAAATAVHQSANSVEDWRIPKQ